MYFGSLTCLWCRAQNWDLWYWCESTCFICQKRDWTLEWHEVSVRYSNSTWQCLAPQSPQFFHSVPQDSPQHHIIAFATSLPRSLLKSETSPEIIKVSDTSTHLGFWWQKHQTMAFVQGSGIATLSPLNYIFSEESSRPNHKDWWQRLQRCNCIIVKPWLTRCLTTCLNHPVLVSSPDTQTLISEASWVNRTVVNHAITVFWDIVAI